MGGQRKSAAPGEAGFTLLEAVVVVAVTALIGGVVFPDLRRTLQALQVRQTAAVIEANLRVARAEAFRQSQPVAFAVEPDGTGFAWTGGPARAVGRGVNLSLLPGRPIVFFADGSSNGGAVSVAGAGAGRRYRLTVDPATGGVDAQ